MKRGLDIQPPRHYFPNDDPNQTPVVRWRSAGQLIYTNWLNYYVYQTTPYDLTSLHPSRSNLILTPANSMVWAFLKFRNFPHFLLTNGGLFCIV